MCNYSLHIITITAIVPVSIVALHRIRRGLHPTSWTFITQQRASQNQQSQKTQSSHSLTVYGISLYSSLTNAELLKGSYSGKWSQNIFLPLSFQKIMGRARCKTVWFALCNVVISLVDKDQPPGAQNLRATGKADRLWK